MVSKYRSLPSVDRLLSSERLQKLDCPRQTLVSLVRQYLEEVRTSLSEGNPLPSPQEMVAAICARAQALTEPSLRPVINATGVLLHTNLGRAPLSREALQAMEKADRGYVNLELEMSTGKRGSRQSHIEPLLCQITGAEAGLVVNNNASGVLLALSALAKRKEVIVSRGQAVEIGGGFRLPEVMKQSGAKMVEVGTTNRTYLADYEQAITPRTAALLRVHTSNYRVVGYTTSVDIGELVELGNRHNIPVLDDLGSGCLLDTTKFGMEAEPMVQASVAAGVGLAFFSGDKLLGGPQAGLIVGKKVFVDKLRRHPLARAVRLDKARLAALIATLLHYLKGEALTHTPIWRMISTPLEEIERRAHKWAEALPELATVERGESMVGGGSLPGSTLPTWLVVIKGGKAQVLAERLRKGEPPVIARVEKNALLLDPRTVLPEEDQGLLKALHKALKEERTTSASAFH